MDQADIAKLRTPLARDDDDAWTKTLEDFKRAYGGRPTLAPVPPLRPTSQRFIAKPEDNHLNWFHPEHLLAEAALLIDRCLGTREKHRELQDEAFRLKLLTEEFKSLDSIHKSEISEGFYSQTCEQLLGEIREVDDASAALFAAYTGYEAILDKNYSSESLRQIKTWSYRSAFAGAEDIYAQALPRAPFTWHGDLNGVQKPEAVAYYAEKLTEKNWTEQRDLLNARREELRSQIKTLDARKVELTRQLAWARKDADFKQRRTVASRDMADARVAESTRAGGALNFVERMKPLEALLERDQRDAAARMRAAAMGLRLIYPYAERCPADADSASLDECAIWIRDTQSWLSAFSRSDQEFILVMSLKNSMGTRWQSFIDTGEGEFSVAREVLPSHLRYIRGRGLAIVAKPQNSPAIDRQDSVWAAEVTCPRSSLLFKGGALPDTLEQSRIPAVFVGKIDAIFERPTREIFGVSVLHNTSPFGVWKIRMGDRSNLGSMRRDLDDLRIEINLAGQPA